MAKQEQILRLMYLAEIFKRKPKGLPYEAVERELEQKFQERDKSDLLKFSEKTFTRDRKDLQELLDMEINYYRSENVYRWERDEDENPADHVFDSILLIDAYRQTAHNSDMMYFEKRKSAGLQNLHGLVHAIQNRKIISFSYTDFWNRSGITQRKTVEAYALKEFNQRWYLLGNERGGDSFFIKTYGLDRLKDLDISASTFTKQTYDVEKAFENSFGIVSTLGQKPVKIVLSFDMDQGRYIKTLPLHRSQRVILDNERELVVELSLVPTFDFYQELLRYTGRMKIVKPVAVKNEYVKLLKTGIELQES